MLPRRGVHTDTLPAAPQIEVSSSTPDSMRDILGIYYRGKEVRAGMCVGGGGVGGGGGAGAAEMMLPH
jgi:hypothetical protein